MTTITLPGPLKDNSQLDRWVAFPAAGQVTISTGRVEIGQGVLTAMLQIAADELDVSPDRIDLHTCDTTLTPNEGYTSGSQSIQQGMEAGRPATWRVPSASSVIISFSRTITSSVLGLMTVLRLTRPTTWSRSGTSIFSPL